VYCSRTYLLLLSLGAGIAGQITRRCVMLCAWAALCSVVHHVHYLQTVTGSRLRGWVQCLPVATPLLCSACRFRPSARMGDHAAVMSHTMLALTLKVEGGMWLAATRRTA
jgi:hypothetical protein